MFANPLRYVYQDSVLSYGSRYSVLAELLFRHLLQRYAARRRLGTAQLCRHSKQSSPFRSKSISPRFVVAADSPRVDIHFPLL
jgi:hypothetical protein